MRSAPRSPRARQDAAGERGSGGRQGGERPFPGGPRKRAASSPGCGSGDPPPGSASKGSERGRARCRPCCSVRPRTPLRLCRRRRRRTHAPPPPSLPPRTGSSPPGHAPGPEDARQARPRRQTAPPPRSSARLLLSVGARALEGASLPERKRRLSEAGGTLYMLAAPLPSRENQRCCLSNCESQEMARPADRPTSCRLGGKARRRYGEEAAGRRRCPGARLLGRGSVCAFPSVQGAGPEHMLAGWLAGWSAPESGYYKRSLHSGEDAADGLGEQDGRLRGSRGRL